MPFILSFGHFGSLRWLSLSLLMSVLAIATFSGCSPYQLQGKVISGPKAMVEVVDSDDPRLNKPGLASSTVQVTVDPKEIRPKRYDTEMADDQGRFAIVINESAAGLLEYQVQIVARRAGHKPTIQTLALPWSGKQVLIVLSPGQDQYQPPSDILRETIKMGDQLQQ